MVYIRELVISPERRHHIAQHGVSPEEVEEICLANPYITRTRQRRLLLIGQTEVGRYLTVIIAPRSRGVYGLVTAREADEKERRLYRRKKGR